MGFFRKKKSCLGYLWKIRRGRRVNVVGIPEGAFQNLRGFNVKKWNSRKGEGVMIKATGNAGSQLQQKIHIFDMAGIICIVEKPNTSSYSNIYFMFKPIPCILYVCNG